MADIEIKPDEISAILRQQLSGFNAGAVLEEVGTVLQMGDGIARVYGLGFNYHTGGFSSRYVVTALVCFNALQILQLFCIA